VIAGTQVSTLGYFNSSVVGYNEEGVGLHACQKSSGVPENKLTQDVKTRWRSTHGMTDSLRVNQEPLLLYEVRKVPALAPAASASASLGSFVDFMASVAHLQAPVPAQVSRVKSEAHRYLELPAAPMNTDPLEWWAANDQLPSVERYGAAVPRCPGHLSLS
jgi:hypothetical protein